MKKIIPWLFIALAFAVGLPSSHGEFEWQTELPAAIQAAKSSHRPLLVYFSGSDWCIVCKHLDAEVLSQKAFQEYADRNLVTFQADFPQYTPQPEALQRQNARIREQFRVETFPTVLVFNSDGMLIGQVFYEPGGPGPFIQQIQQVLQNYARALLQKPAPPH